MGGQRVDAERAEKEARDAGMEPLEPYPGRTKDSWHLRCTACGEAVITCYNRIQQRGRQCRTCGYAASGMARRIPEADAVAVMLSKLARPLEPYPGSHEPWKCICQVCGHVITPTYSAVKHGQGACEYCGGNRVDPAEAAELMRSHSLEPLIDYPGSANPWKCRCLDCGRTVTPRYNDIQQSQGGCGHCAGVVVDSDEAVAVMRMAGLEPLTPYPGHNKAPWPCICASCDEEVTPRYNTIQQGGRGCDPCGKIRGGLALRLPETLAAVIMSDARAKALEPYTGSMKPWRCLCMECGREISPRLHSVKAGHGPCAYCTRQKVDPREAELFMIVNGIEPAAPFPGVDEPWPGKCLSCGGPVRARYTSIKAHQGGCTACAEYGFNYYAPAVIYLIHHLGWNSIKIGIMNLGSSRLKEHHRHGWRTVLIDGIPCTWGTPIGEIAYDIEQSILTWWRLELGAPIAVDAALMRQKGATETVSLAHVDLQQTARRVAALVESHADLDDTV